MSKTEEGYEEIGIKDFWKAEKVGEKISGKVVEIMEGDFGKQYVILREDETKVTTPSHRVLQNRLSDVETGDMLIIEYIGEEAPKVKGQSATQMYKVMRKKAE